MAQGSNQIGEAFVDLRLRMDKLEADAAQAKAKVAQLTEQIEQSATSTQQTARQTDGWVTSLTKAGAALVAIVATARTFMSIGESIGRVLVSNTEKLDEFLLKLSQADAKAQSAGARTALVEQLSQQRDAEDLRAFPVNPLMAVARTASYVSKYGISGLVEYGSGQLDDEVAKLQREQRGQTGAAVSRASRNATNIEREASASFRDDLNRLTNALNEATEAIKNNPSPR